MTDETNELENDDLDEFFGGQEETEVESEVAEEPKGETEETEAEAKEEPETEPPSDKEPTLVPIAAVLDERRKAQQLKEELEELRKQVPQKDEAPDPYDDPEAYLAYHKSKWQQEQYMEQERATRERLEDSRSQMLAKADDYVEMEKVFEIMTLSDESLVGKMLASEDPAKFAYDSARQYRESLLGKVEVVKESEPEVDERKESAVKAPNLATATAQGKNTPEIEKEDDLEDVFADQEYQSY